MSERHSWNASLWSNWDQMYRGQFFNSLYGARSVALLCSQGEVWNAAPVSQIIHVGANPPRVGVLMRPNSAKHQSQSNLFREPWASLHFMPEDHAHRVHQASAAYTDHDSELAILGWDFHPWEDYPAILLKDACLSLCLEVNEVLALQNGTALYVFDIHAIESQGTPDSLGHWPITENILHSQGLDYYGHAVMTHGPLPYARP